MAEFITVKSGISASVAHEVSGAESVDAYISDQIDRIDDENPHLMKELCSFALLVSQKLDLADPKLTERLRAHLVSAGIIVYRMLESQSEADSML